MRPPDPTIEREPYDPDKPNPAIDEIKRQKAAGVHDDDLDWDKAFELMYKGQGKVHQNGKWVKDEPYSQANWHGDGA